MHEMFVLVTIYIIKCQSFMKLLNFCLCATQNRDFSDISDFPNSKQIRWLAKSTNKGIAQ